jgi:hypothetical protein
MVNSPRCKEFGGLGERGSSPSRALVARLTGGCDVTHWAVHGHAPGWHLAAFTALRKCFREDHGRAELPNPRIHELHDRNIEPRARPELEDAEGG